MWTLSKDNNSNYHSVINKSTGMIIPLGSDHSKSEKVARLLNAHGLEQYNIKNECLVLTLKKVNAPIEISDVYARESTTINTIPVFKLGIDIHGVADNDPDFFRKLAQSVIDANGEVHILTGTSKLNEPHWYAFEQLNIPYTHIFSVTDYLLDRGHDLNEGSTVERPWFPDEIWNPVKAIYCKQHNISLHYDDSESYIKYFETPVIHYHKET